KSASQGSGPTPGGPPVVRDNYMATSRERVEDARRALQTAEAEVPAQATKAAEDIKNAQDVVDHAREAQAGARVRYLEDPNADRKYLNKWQEKLGDAEARLAETQAEAQANTAKVAQKADDAKYALDRERDNWLRTDPRRGLRMAQEEVAAATEGVQ